MSKCDCPCDPIDHKPGRGCTTWYGDKNTGFRCECDWWEGKMERPVVEHQVMIVVRSDLAYHEVVSALVASAQVKFPGPVEAHGYDPKKLPAELATVTEERNLAVAECHRLRCELERSAREPRYSNALEWIEHNVVVPVVLRCQDPPFHAINGIALVARALSESGKPELGGTTIGRVDSINPNLSNVPRDKRLGPVAVVHDEPVCDTMDCFRPPVRQVDVFGEPGGPGVSAFVCEECAQEHERHKAGLDEAQKRINERRISEPPKKGRKKR